MRVAAIVLAAGGSTRMGLPKQLLQLNGKPLIVRAIETVLALPIESVTVVLGASADSLQTLLAKSFDSKIRTVINPDWANGMGSSIRTGVTAALSAFPDVDAVLITLCDQPRVSTADLSALLSEFGRGDCQAVAAGYSGTVGVPALFGPGLFESLKSLANAGGAKSILAGPGVAVIAIPTAAVDVDTPDDFSRLAESELNLS